MAYDLYVITDEEIAGGLPHETLAERAIAGGADVIQLRDKQCDYGRLVRIGRKIARIARDAGVLFIVNDRLDVAIACGADGVHLGQDDMRPDVARQIAPPGFIIGVSAGNVAEALLAEQQGADYVALSPTFDTASKYDAGPGHGILGLRKMRAAVSIPVIAIGGINRQNAAEVIRAGADGIAVISAVVGSPDITRAARELKKIITDCKKEKMR